MRRHLSAILLALALTLPAATFVGCSILNSNTPAQNAANQKAIDNRHAMVDARASYAAAERLIVKLHQSGTITAETGKSLISELHNTVRPLLEAAQAATVAGDFDTAVLKFTTALANVTSKVPATPATRPAAIVPSTPPVDAEPVRAAFPVAIILGEIALQALQAYRRKKDEELAESQGDATRIAELDKQLAAELADDDAADKEANAEFGIVDPNQSA